MVSEEAWAVGERWDLEYEIVDTEMKGKGLVGVYHLYQKSKGLRACILDGIRNLNQSLVDLEVNGENGPSFIPKIGRGFSNEEKTALLNLGEYIEILEEVERHQTNNFLNLFQNAQNLTKIDSNALESILAQKRKNSIFYNNTNPISNMNP